jgi:hypothetical protein
VSLKPAYFDKIGQPMAFEEWYRIFEDMTYRRVAETFLPNGVRVSTVWMGLDHRFGGPGLPLIFESMVFYSGSSSDQDCERYSTMAEAEKGHAALVEKWRVVPSLAQQAVNLAAEALKGAR